MVTSELNEATSIKPQVFFQNYSPQSWSSNNPSSGLSTLQGKLYSKSEVGYRDNFISKSVTRGVKGIDIFETILRLRAFSQK
tara:strand:- start:337 stop:582 length:246 start_codon:yes stop_codon:yes gene_type:complete